MHLLIGSSSPLGRGAGINAYVEELSAALRQLGHRVSIACPVDERMEWQTESTPGICPTDPETDALKSARELLAYIGKESVDGVINNDNPVLQNVLPYIHCPAIVVGHMADFTLGPLVAHNHAWADYVVAISNDMYERFVVDYKVDPMKCVIVHNGVSDRRDTQPQFAKRAGAPLKVVFCGGFTRPKGADLIQESLLSSRRHWEGIELHWFGRMSARQMDALQRTGVVRCHGQVPRSEFIESLAQADVLLLPSRVEGCPMVMLEAMSLGVVPIVSNGVGAMRWLIESGRDGVVIPLSVWPENSAHCLSYLKDNPEVRQSMRAAVTRRFSANYQIRDVALRFISLLEKPRVSRNGAKRTTTSIVSWHRPPKPRFLDRLRWRFGYLQCSAKVGPMDMVIGDISCRVES